MRDFSEERAVLHAIAETMRDREVVVSYNGKSYDSTILATRFTLHKLPNPFNDLPHVDLLHAVRRLWNRRLESCTLGQVERDILEFFRKDDVPGFLIPGLYFDFIRSGRVAPLLPVFQHNQWDVAALAAIAGRLASVHVHHQSENDVGTLMGLARNFERLDMIDEAIHCYRRAFSETSSSVFREEALYALGLIYKRSDRWEEAMEIWKALLHSFPLRLHPLEEILKALEHRFHRFEEAETLILQSLDRLQTREFLSCSTISEPASRARLEYRLHRIRTKMARRRFREHPS